MRPTLRQNVIDFDGRTGYVRTAIDAGVPIVPMVSIGGQETQLFLTRGTSLAKRVGIVKRLTRSELVPIAARFPFGLTLGCVNFPLPSKIVTQVLPAIDIRARFGEDPDVAAVDAYVRKVMQKALDKLARRTPVASTRIVDQPAAAASGRTPPTGVKSAESPAAHRISVKASIMASVASCGSVSVMSSVSTEMAS